MGGLGNLAHLLASDTVSVPLLSPGIPTCAFLLGYSGMFCRQVPVHVTGYLLGAVIGVAMSLFGGVVTSYIAFTAAANASVDDFSKTSGQAYAVTILAWPLGCCLLAFGMFMLTGRNYRTVRSVLAALAVGFLAGTLNFVTLSAVGLTFLPGAGVLSSLVLGIYLPILLVGKFRVMAFIVTLAAALAVSLIAMQEHHRAGLVTNPRAKPYAQPQGKR